MKNSNARVVTPTVGVDLGDRKSRVCVLDEGGEIVEEASIATTRTAFERKFGRLDRSLVVIETGTHSNWVHDVLVSSGHEVLVADARRLRAVTQNVRKSDEVDAQLLARLGRSDAKLIKPIEVKPELTRIDLGLLRARAALVEARTQLCNAVRGLAKTAGHRLPSCSTASLHKQTVHESLNTALSPLLRVLKEASTVISEYDKEIERLCASRYTQTIPLQKIHGVGALSALYFVLTVGDPKRFHDARNVGAYLGLVPRRSQSGESDPQLGITKSGDRMGRALLVQCAHHILGPFGADSDLRRFGLKLAARGGKSARKRAVVATARKLAVLLFALLRNGEVYEPLRNSAKNTAS